MSDGSPGQDAFRVTASGAEGGILVAVACDGAGSTSHGRHGAVLAARTVSEHARIAAGSAACPPGAVDFAPWVLLARLRITVAAAVRGLRERDFATTLVAAVSDGTTTVVGHVGDGAVVARDAGTGLWSALSWPEHGDYASTTRFITEDGAPALRVSLHEGAVDRLALMTDGLERLALDFGLNVPHAPFFDAMFAPFGQHDLGGRNDRLSRLLGDYLDSDRINARTDDDKTLVLAAFG